MDWDPRNPWLGLRNGLYVRHLKKRDMYDVSHGRNLHFLRRIGRRDLSGHKNTWIGRTSNGMRSFRATRHGHNLGGTQRSGLHSKLERRRYMTRTVCNQGTSERLDGCFRDR